jgi:hypothetical protein
MGERIPGSMCQETKPQNINDGTSVRCASPTPGPTSGRVPLTPSGLARIHGGMRAGITVEVDENELEMVVMTVDEFRELVAKPVAEMKVPPSEKQKSIEPLKQVKHLAHTIPELAEWVKIVEEMGFKAKMRFQKVNGVDCVILSGRTGLRQILHPKATHLKVGTPKVIEMVIGRAGLTHATMHSLKVGVILSVAVNSLKVAHSAIKGESGIAEALYTLLSNTIVDVGKVGISSLAGLLAGTLLTLTGVAVLPLAGAILVGVAVGLSLDYFYPTKDIVKLMEKKISQMWGQTKRILEETWQTETPGLISLPPMAGFLNNNLPVAWGREEKELINALITA